MGRVKPDPAKVTFLLHLATYAQMNSELTALHNKAGEKLGLSAR